MTTRLRRRTALLVDETVNRATKLTSYWMSGWSDAKKLNDPTADLKSVFAWSASSSWLDVFSS